MSLRRRASRLPLRVRLVAGFAVVMLVVLTGAGAFVYWRVQYALDRGLDGELRQASSTLRPLVAADGTVTDTRAADATGSGWQVLRRDGTRVVVTAHGGPAGTTPLAGSAVLAGASRGAVTRDVGRLLPVTDAPLRLRVEEVHDGTWLLVSVRRNGRDEALRELLVQLAVAGLGALLLTALVGDRLAWSALLPVERYRRRAEQVVGGAVGVRLDVPAGRDDEVTRLGSTLNAMLDALEASVARERRFVDEASHELRTPLTLLTSRIQLARRRPRTVAEHEQVLDELGQDVTRLTALAEQLLSLGAAGAVAGPARCDLAVVVATAVASYDGVGVGGGPGPVEVDCDEGTATRVVTNLLDNAVAHGGLPVQVVVDRVRGSDGRAWGRLLVVDAGPGMPAELLEAATQRFARAPEARSRPGAGLGLSLVEALVVGRGGGLRLCSGGRHVRHGGAAEVACAHDDRMTVTVLLPVLPGRSSAPPT